MSFFGSSEPAGIAVRWSSKCLRTSSLSSRPRPYIIHRIPRMTATTPRSPQLWSLARGISLLPVPAAPTPCAQSPHSASEASVHVETYYDIATVGAENKTWAEPIIQPIPPPQGVQSALSTPDLQGPVRHVDSHSAGQSETKDKEAKVTAEAEKKPNDEPPPAVLDYKIADDLFYAAKKALSGDAKSFWSYTQYRRTGEDGKQQKVVLHYCRSKQTMEEVCRQYFKDEKLLGFDLEWVPDSRKHDDVKKNVSLIQLASPSRVALFHVALFANNEDMVGPSFRRIMEDPTVIKVGVAIKGDTTRLRNYLNIDSRGLIELSNLYKLVTYCRTGQYQNINRKLVPLAKQVEEYLHLPLYKGQNVRSSDWSKPLAWDQLVYSASDAYAGVQLYATLEHHRKQLDPCPPTPHFAELNLAIPFAGKIELTDSDETAETTEAEPLDECASVSLGESEKYLAEALETLNIEDGEAAAPLYMSVKTKTSLVPKEKSKMTTVATKSPERPKDSRVEVAEDRATSYRTSHPKTSASIPHLRAYYLWHCYNIPPANIAQLLRDPPLKTITVVQYILSVVQSENLSVDHDELRELAGFVPLSTLWARWPVVAKMISTTRG